MLGNNPFGAFQMDEGSSSGGPSTRQVEGEEVDVDWIRLIKANHDVNVRVCDKVDLDGLPLDCCLMAVSNALGLLFVGGNNDVRIHRLADFRAAFEGSAKDSSAVSTPVRTLSLPARPVWITLAVAETRLAVTLANGAGIYCWIIREVMERKLQPYNTFTSNLPSSLLDVLPNPCPPSSDLSSSTASTPADTLSGYVVLLAKEGLVVADVNSSKLSAPLPGPFTCACWSAKGKQIVVGTPSGKLVQYTPEGEAKAEVPPPPELDPSVQYYPSFVRWLENDLFLTAYAQANGEPSDLLEMFVIHRQGAAFTFTKFFDPLDTMGVTGRSGTYRYFAGLRDWGAKTKHLSFVMSGLASEIAVMHGQPAGKGEVSKWEVLILDETARGIMPAAKKGVSDETSCLGLSLDLTSDKGIRQGIQGGIEQPDLPPAPRLLAYSQEGLILAFDVLYPDAGRYEGMVKPGEVEDVRTEQAMNSTNEVSSLRTASFGSNPFGLSTSPSTPVKHPTAFGGSAFGQSTTPAFGSSSKPAAFGASAFGQSSVPASTSPNTAPSALANTKPAAFGQSAFGQSRTPAAFRAQSFGKPASAGFGSPSSPFAESSSSGSSGFGQFAKPATASAFGSSSITSTGLGFGAFGAKPASATTGFGFGASAFGQPARPAATPSTQGPSQASPFGSGGMVSAFGSSSGFGQSAIGTKPAPNSGPSQSSAFAGFGSPSQFQNAANLNAGTASSPSPLAQTDSGDSGLGGFSSALDTSNAALPGLDDSPPTSPVGISGRLGGMDDDSPPNSPPLQPVPMTSGQRPQAVSSAFIKPATAFGGASSSGTFGQSANKTTSAFLPGSTPAAFASPASSTTSAPTSAPAFGQQSPMTPTSSSGSAFGQPSVPIAFGKPTAPTSPAAGFANITGGFGSFAAKPASPSTDAVPKPRGFGGFGGFAAAGVSAFGEKRVENAFLSMLSEGTEPTEATKSPLASPFSAPQVTTTSVPEVTKPPAEPVKPASPPFLESIVSEKSQLETPSKPGEPPNRPVETSSTPASIPSATSSATILPIPDDEPEVEEPVSEDEADHSGSATEIVDDERDYSQEELTDEHEDEDEEGYEGESDHRDQEQRRQSCVVRSPSDEYVPDETRSNTTESGKDEDRPTTRAKFPSTEISHPEGMAPTTDDTVSKGPAAISAPEPSLLSRLGPPAPAQAAFSASPVPKFPAFNLKHAARTSSPLSVHPPETLVDSTTPPASPAGKPQSASSVANLFTPVVKKEVKSISPVPNAQPAPAEASNPGAGLGLGRPPSAPPKASTPPVADMKPSSSLPFSFAKPSGNPLPSSPAAPSFIAAKPPAASPQAGVDEAAKPPSTFAVPARPTVSAAPSRRERANKSMVVVLERMITDLLADVQNLRSSLQANAKFHRALEVSNFGKVHGENLDRHNALPFSSIKDIAAIVDDLSEQVVKLRTETSGSEMKLGELQSRILKTDMKIGQADRFLKAKQDPSFARVMQVRDLNPEQAASQVKLRKAVQVTEARLEELDAGIAGLKKRADRRESGRHTAGQPALERVQRSVRNVDAAIRDRQQTVDDLARRIGSIRLAKLGRSREGSVAPSSIRREQPASPSQSTISPSRISFDTPDDVVADVEAILDRDSSRIQNRIKGMKIARLTQGGTKPGSKGYLAHASLANGPIMIDALPLPGSLPIVDVKPDISGASVKSTVPQPERDLMLTTNGTASAFGGIKLSFEAGDLASTQSSRTSRSSTTHRTHTAAAKLGSSPRSGAPPTSSMSFTLPNAASPAPTGAPAGFFSFNGYGKDWVRDV